MRNYTSSPIDIVTRCYFGGGAPSPPPMPEFKPPKLPPPPPTPPPAAPPPEPQTMSANDASEMARRAAAQRQGYRKTILAGENQPMPPSNPATGNSLLG